MTNSLVLAAFQQTPLNADNLDRTYEVDASLKDAFKKAGMYANKIKGGLRKKLANYHTHEVHKHEGAAKKSTPNTMKHLYHSTMSQFHRMRLSHALSGRKHELHKTVHPSKIELQHNKHGEVKKPASRAEQAAHQHHQEHANNLAHAHNELKEKGFHQAAKNVASAHHEEANKAKAIAKRRSMPKTEKVKLKEVSKPVEEKKSGKGAYSRTDKHRNAIRTGKAEHEAVKQGRKMSDITTRKRITEKNHDAIKEARKGGKATKEEKPAAKKTVKKVAEKAPKAEKKVATKKETPAKTSKRVKKVAEEKPAVKKRGRPAGSKNKPKEAPVKEEKPAVKKTTRRKKAA